MHVLVTGAGGFVGQALVQRLLGDAAAMPFPLTRLTVIDQRFGLAAESWRADKRVALFEGDFADPGLLDRAVAHRPEGVFHLASVPGSLAEREQALGLQVNLLAPISLLQRLADQSAHGRPLRVVFASSVAVYGALPTEGAVDESCAVRPALSYGAHKRMTEILLADLSRQGLLDGVSLRLPGIVARPRSPTGHGSAFMSDLIRCLMTDESGDAYDCPVSAQASCWRMSLVCCVDNLLHAARLPAPQLLPERCLQLPVLTATVGELVAAIEQLTGQPANLRYSPNPLIEMLFGRLPALHTPYSRSLGFADDGSLARLIHRALVA